MANRYWVTGGDGNWNSTTNWSTSSGGASGASVPGSSDAALLDASSGSGTVTLDISPTIQTLTCTGFTGTLAFGANTISLNSTGTIFTGATTMTVTGTPLIICTNSSATARTITPGAVTEANSISFRITAGTGTFTISSPQAVRDLDFTDGVNPTGFAGALASAASAITVYGSFKASTGMTQNAGTSALTFAATSGIKTINTAGVTFDRPFTFNGVGGTFQLQAALTSGATRTCTLTNGTLDLNGYTLTTGTFTGTGSGVRSLVTNSVPIVVTGSGAAVVNFGTTTNLTVDVTPTFNLTYSGSVGTRTISVGATANLPAAPNITVTAGSDIVTTSGTTTLTNLIFTSGFTGTLGNATRNIYGNLTLVSGMATPTSGSLVTTFNGVGSQTITTAGKTLDFPITFDGVGGTWTLQDALTSGVTRTVTLTNGTLGLASYTLTTGLFNSNNSNTRVLAFGTGKIVLTGLNATIYNTATATGFTMTGTRTVELTGVGVGGETRIIQSGNITAGGSAANAANFYIKAGADAISFSTANRVFGTLDFTGFSGSTLANGSPNIYGDLVLSTGMSVTGGTNAWVFAATTSQTITTNGKTIDNPITFNGVGGVWAMQDALTLDSASALTLVNGTLRLKNGTTNTVGSIATSGTNQKFLQSTVNGSRATLSAAAGVSDVSYVTVKDSAATGGARFQAFTSNGNVNAGNNTGWYFINAVGFLSFF